MGKICANFTCGNKTKNENHVFCPECFAKANASSGKCINPKCGKDTKRPRHPYCEECFAKKPELRAAFEKMEKEKDKKRDQKGEEVKSGEKDDFIIIITKPQSKNGKVVLSIRVIIPKRFLEIIGVTKLRDTVAEMYYADNSKNLKSYLTQEGEANFYDIEFTPSSISDIEETLILIIKEIGLYRERKITIPKKSLSNSEILIRNAEGNLGIKIAWLVPYMEKLTSMIEIFLRDKIRRIPPFVSELMSSIKEKIYDFRKNN